MAEMQKSNWQILAEVQQELKAPKGQYNSFGKYKYRSCEDILEAVKPILRKYGATITLSDTLELIGDRFYIKATATFYTGAQQIAVTAYAREETEKKGMDGSQITGTASSYARKYALNGLFLIDDTKDADTDEFTARTVATARRTVTATTNPPAPADDGVYRCEICGKPVTADYASKSIQKCGHVYCSKECHDKGEKANA